MARHSNWSVAWAQMAWSVAEPMVSALKLTMLTKVSSERCRRSGRRHPWVRHRLSALHRRKSVEQVEVSSELVRTSMLVKSVQIHRSGPRHPWVRLRRSELRHPWAWRACLVPQVQKVLEQSLRTVRLVRLGMSAHLVLLVHLVLSVRSV
jgi:hypothetical protein